MGLHRSLGMPPTPASRDRPGGWLCWLALALVLLVGPMVERPQAAWAAPGMCVGPVCADQISRSAKLPWQLRLRFADQMGHRERLLVDCRDGTLSPLMGPVDRRYAGAVARRVCRLAA